jgi:hypothetical protein
MRRLLEVRMTSGLLGTVVAVLALSVGCGSGDSKGGDVGDSGAGESTEGGSSARGGNTAQGDNSVDGGAAGDAGASESTQGGSTAMGGNTARGGSTAMGGSTSTGGGPTVGRCPVFSAESAWNQDVSELPLHPQSDAFIDSIGADGTLHPDFGTVWDGAPIGIPYVVVDGQAKVDINFVAYGDESDPGPYPIPADAPIEGGPDSDGDRHVLVIDQSDCTLYELGRAFPNDDRTWDADCGAVWDLNGNPSRPAGWTSADAAGLPIFPGLARYDEVVEQGEVLHALRFTVSSSQRAHVAPASHYASSSTDSSLPPMGLRLRMRSDFDCSGLSSEVNVLCTALKRFGMIVADNGSDWYISGAPDSRWSDENLSDLGSIPGSAFEVVDTGAFVTP